MIFTKIKVNKVVSDNGLVGFASVVLNDCLFLGNIAIFSRLNQPDKFRLVFPEKKNGDKKIQLFYPLTSDFYFLLEKEIIDEFKK